MKKIIMLLCIIGCCLVFIPNLFAASAKCTIVKIKDTTMTIECPKGIERFEKAKILKIKSVKEKKIEGC